MNAERLRAEGWEMTPAGGFTNHAGPFWLRGEGVDVEIGLVIEERHCNEHMGTLHGGVAMTFADIALGAPGARALGGANCVTTQLNTHFIATAHRGEFLYCKPELLRLTSKLFFTRGVIVVGERVIANCDGIWTIVNPKALAPKKSDGS